MLRFTQLRQASLLPRAVLARNFQSSALRRLAVGDSVPSSPVLDGPDKEVSLADKTASGKFLIVGVPGAFTPACSQRHIPEFIRDFEKFQEKGIKKIYVVTVNDPFVATAWQEKISETVNVPHVGKYVDVHADPTGNFPKAWDVTFDGGKLFGHPRSQRYVAYIEDGKVAKVFREADGTSLNETAADKVLEQI